MDLLRDREERQRRYCDYGGDYDGGGGGSTSRWRRGRRGGNNPVIQDFGSVHHWYVRKNGRGRSGKGAVGDNVVGVGGPFHLPGDVPPPCPPGAPRDAFDARFNDDDYFPLDNGNGDINDVIS